MKKLLLLLTIAFTSVAANAQVAQEPVKKTMDVNTRQKAKEIKKASSIDAFIQKRKTAKLVGVKKNK